MKRNALTSGLLAKKILSVCLHSKIVRRNAEPASLAGLSAFQAKAARQPLTLQSVQQKINAFETPDPSPKSFN